MKIFVISDTHGQLDKVYDILKNIKDIDLLIHCGDYYQDAMELQKKLPYKIIAVKGNCDKCFDKNNYAIVETECGNILITHGHMQNVKFSQQQLMYFAEEKNCVAAIYGHTHIATYVEYDGMHIINPGSISKPRDNSEGSYCIISTSQTSFDVSIHYFNGQKKKTHTGRLRKLLNYSDRF